ncbi:Ig-like domain-containing protein [Dokdonella sp.]|uniref:beta strand repeat-containing protein n=1 Tax=Dokdonella sp. TaxID=2291710 RepID=UPI001B1413D6|nr:Ig-like domain-containing protein [Dokdonella sp.]MBO9662763.1 Ig-like domain-containing protein [Dokdonella sp.]
MNSCDPRTLRARCGAHRHRTPRRALAWLAACAIALLATATGAVAAPIAVGNGDFSSAANAGSVGGGVLGGSGTDVPIGAGPWTGTYAGAIGLLAPPTLSISATTQKASISGLLGISALVLVNNGGYLGQTLTTNVQSNTRYVLSADVDAGRVLQLGLLNNTHTGVAIAAGGAVLASSDTQPAGAVTLQLLQGTTYRLTMTYVSPTSIAASPIEVRLFAQPRGLLTVDLLPTITFDNVALDAVALGVPAAVGNIAGDGQSATVNTLFPVPLGLRVLDGVGNGVAGTQVTFTAPAAGASATFNAGGNSGSVLAVLTDANGDASVATTANTVAGAYTISVQVAGLADPQIFHLTNTAGAPAVVSIPNDGSGGGTQSTTVDTPFPQPLVVGVSDSFGNAVAATSVSFAVAPAANGAGATLSSPQATTGADGRATITARANLLAGQYAVNASVAGVPQAAAFSLTNTAGTQATIAASGGGTQSTAVTTPFAQPLQVTVNDAFGNPVSGVAVAFSAATSGGASAVLSAASATTGADGTASVGATANAQAGSYVVSASVSGVGTAAAFQLTNTAGAPTAIVATGGGTQSAPVENPFPQPLAVQARDAFGNPVPNVSVSFVATPAANGASATLSASVAMTGADGIANVGATANSIAGAYTVGASAGGATAAVFGLTNTAGPPSAIVIGASGSGTQSTTVNTPFPTPLVVRINDSHGNPVPNVAVAFTPPASGASAALSATGATTGANGEAQVQATANTVAGHYLVSATVAGVPGAFDFDLTNTAGTPHDVVPIGGDGSVGGGTQQSTPIDTAFPLPLKVRVRDEFQNPVAGVVAQYVAPASGASAMLSAGPQNGATLNVATNAAGEAVVQATANSTVGSYTVTAQVAGVSTPVTYHLSNTPGNSSTPIGGGTQAAVVDQPFACALIVRLADPQGQPRAGISVDFTAPASGASASLSANGGAGGPTATAVTDLDGVAYVEATANAIPGKYQVSAQEAGVPTAQVTHFALENLDPADPIFRNGFDLDCGGSP